MKVSVKTSSDCTTKTLRGLNAIHKAKRLYQPVNVCTNLLPFRDCVSHAVTAPALVEVCTRTTVDVEATYCGDPTLEVLCAADGCSRGEYGGYDWLCVSFFPNTEDCWFGASFGEPQDLVLMRIELGQDAGSIQALKLFVDGEDHGLIAIPDKTTVYHVFDFDTHDVSEVKVYTDDCDSVEYMDRIIHQVRQCGSTTLLTFGRESVATQPLHKLK